MSKNPPRSPKSNTLEWNFGYRLLQLIAQCVLIGSGNMTDEDVQEMKELSGYKHWNERPRKRKKKA